MYCSHWHKDIAMSTLPIATMDQGYSKKLMAQVTQMREGMYAQVARQTRRHVLRALHTISGVQGREASDPRHERDPTPRQQCGTTSSAAGGPLRDHGERRPQILRIDAKCHGSALRTDATRKAHVAAAMHVFDKHQWRNMITRSSATRMPRRAQGHSMRGQVPRQSSCELWHGVG